MLRAFAGDPFLARRAAVRALADLRAADASLEVVRLDEGRRRERRGGGGQGGLFGRVALFLDLDEAFVGAGHTAERNAVIEALATAAPVFAGGGAEGSWSTPRPPTRASVAGASSGSCASRPRRATAS
jgi:hypothetical protein